MIEQELQQFSDFADDSRLWVFASSTPLSPESSLELEQDLEGFVSTWKSHGRSVHGKCAVHLQCFILVVADTTEELVSGCGIDSLVRAVESALGKHGMRLHPPTAVWIYDEQTATATALEKATIRNKLADRELSPTVPVFNHSIQSLGELRTGKWCQPLECSTYRSAFANFLAES